ncbi:hypothetical protein NDU88_002297 [Pleurodeles waltl]|uniref:Uncharacterized protein n=1 Tax=Pleurodeles waltl TaxID=8319 RepID=A0AAV7TKQ2_PLEWA|nr:hypothetical protein NDU88_002297 [Pleurodeles waltl]
MSSVSRTDVEEGTPTSHCLSMNLTCIAIAIQKKMCGCKRRKSKGRVNTHERYQVDITAISASGIMNVKGEVGRVIWFPSEENPQAAFFNTGIQAALISSNEGEGGCESGEQNTMMGNIVPVIEVLPERVNKGLANTNNSEHASDHKYMKSKSDLIESEKLAFLADLGYFHGSDLGKPVTWLVGHSLVK